jgi:uncharacterized protein
MQTPWGEVAVSDAHAHFFSHRFFHSLALLAGKSAGDVAGALGCDLPPRDPAELARDWAAELDRHGVERCVLIASVPGDEASVLAALDACPGRFFAYAMVNPLADGAAVAEGLHAICLFPAMHRYSIQDPRVEPLLDQAAERGAAVFVHCGVLTVGVRGALGLPSPFDMRFSNPIDLHGVALRHPRLRFIVPHFGAGYFREALMLASLCPNVYLDTSSGNSWMRYEGLDLATVFARTLAVTGPKRLLFGTDSNLSFPRGWHARVFDTQVQALAGLGLSRADAHAIFGGNLERLFS